MNKDPDKIFIVKHTLKGSIDILDCCHYQFGIKYFEKFVFNNSKKCSYLKNTVVCFI